MNLNNIDNVGYLVVVVAGYRVVVELYIPAVRQSTVISAVVDGTENITTSWL